MGCRWGAHGLLMGRPWVSAWGAHGSPVKHPWVVVGSPMDYSRVTDGFSVACPWVAHVSSLFVGFPCVIRGFSVAHPRVVRGSFMGYSWGA